MFANQGIKFWYQAARPLSFGQSVMPYVLGALLGASTLVHGGVSPSLELVSNESTFLTSGIMAGLAPATGMLSILVAIVAGLIGLVGIIAAHAGMNLLDDYFDMKKGAVQRREELLDGGFRARLGKCAYLKSGAVTLADTKRAALSFLYLALALGALGFVLRGWEILIFAAAALALGVFYAGPPLRLSYRGFGELVIGFLFGPVLVTAASFLVSGQISYLALFCSIPIGLLVANIVQIHAVMDYGSDLAAQRKTLPILLGSERAGIAVSVIFVVLAQAVILIGIALGFLPIAAILIVATYPLSLVFIRLALLYLKDKNDDSFRPKKWMGNYGDWEKFCTDGLDWFMSRWLTARNLVMQVTLVLAVTAFTPWYL